MGISPAKGDLRTLSSAVSSWNRTRRHLMRNAEPLAPHGCIGNRSVSNTTRRHHGHGTAIDTRDYARPANARSAGGAGVADAAEACRAQYARPAVLAIGTTYLRTVGPFFGFFGIGYALYCAGQGMGRMGWPVAGAVTRAAVAVVGGAAAIRLGANLDHIFMAVSIGMMSFGLFSLPGLFLRSGYGTRQRSSAARGPTAVCTR